MTRRRSTLARIERDAYLASRTAGDLHAAQEGPAALAGRVARRQVRRRLYAAGAPVVPLPRGRRRAPSGPPPAMGVGGALLMLAALVAGVALTVATGWAGFAVGVVLFLGACLFAGRGGRDGLRK